MLTKTNYTVNKTLFQDACDSLPSNEMKTPINQPTGNFFYDPWVLKDEYKGTVWEALYNSLPVTKGEARIIILDPGKAYQSHADIDDRYHLNISGEECFLIDLDQRQLHKLETNGVWYDMNAGLLHTAANFGRIFRIQLVVRKLLKVSNRDDLILCKIISNISNPDDARFEFDNRFSSILNQANKLNNIKEFNPQKELVTFYTTSDVIASLKDKANNLFEIV